MHEGSISQTSRGDGHGYRQTLAAPNATIPDFCPMVPDRCLGCGLRHPTQEYLKYHTFENGECKELIRQNPLILQRYIRRMDSGRWHMPFCLNKKQCFMKASSKVVEFLSKVISEKRPAVEQCTFDKDGSRG